MRRVVILSFFFLSSCHSPYYMPRKLDKLDADIKEAAQYMLSLKINNVNRNSTNYPEMVKRLKRLKVDHGEILWKEKQIRNNEPNDSIVVFTRTRSASLLMWCDEDLIYDFSKSARTFNNYSEKDDYQFRKISDRVYYRRSYSGAS